jgi:hypothetical protein
LERFGSRRSMRVDAAFIVGPDRGLRSLGIPWRLRLRLYELIEA